MEDRMVLFDPARLARYERDNYVYYYQQRWLKLLVVSVRMVQEAYGLGWARAAYGAYLVARAEMAFAPRTGNDPPKALAYLRRFYALVGRARGWTLDIARAAECELNWWIVHRQLFAQAENAALVDALATLLVTVYGVDPPTAQRAASLRARGMLLSDRWVRGGMEPRSPLLEQEESLLCQGYAVLKEGMKISSRKGAKDAKEGV